MVIGGLVLFMTNSLVLGISIIAIIPICIVALTVHIVKKKYFNNMEGDSKSKMGMK